MGTMLQKYRSPANFNISYAFKDVKSGRGELTKNVAVLVEVMIDVSKSVFKYRYEFKLPDCFFVVPDPSERRRLVNQILIKKMGCNVFHKKFLQTINVDFCQSLVQKYSQIHPLVTACALLLLELKSSHFSSC